MDGGGAVEKSGGDFGGVVERGRIVGLKVLIGASWCWGVVRLRSAVVAAGGQRRVEGGEGLVGSGGVGC